MLLRCKGQRRAIWRTFEVIFLSLILMDNKIMVWNCQGAASKRFKQVTKSFIDVHKPNMLVLLEPRISGVGAERVIHYFWYNHSHCVEALGYP